MASATQSEWRLFNPNSQTWSYFYYENSSTHTGIRWIDADGAAPVEVAEQFGSRVNFYSAGGSASDPRPFYGFDMPSTFTQNAGDTIPLIGNPNSHNGNAYQWNIGINALWKCTTGYTPGTGGGGTSTEEVTPTEPSVGTLKKVHCNFW